MVAVYSAVEISKFVVFLNSCQPVL